MTVGCSLAQQLGWVNAAKELPVGQRPVSAPGRHPRCISAYEFEKLLSRLWDRVPVTKPRTALKPCDQSGFAFDYRLKRHTDPCFFAGHS